MYFYLLLACGKFFGRTFRKIPRISQRVCSKNFMHWSFRFNYFRLVYPKSSMHGSSKHPRRLLFKCKQNFCSSALQRETQIVYFVKIQKEPVQTESGRNISILNLECANNCFTVEAFEFFFHFMNIKKPLCIISLNSSPCCSISHFSLLGMHGTPCKVVKSTFKEFFCALGWLGSGMEDFSTSSAEFKGFF